jgi:hypothetical protein
LNHYRTEASERDAAARAALASLARGLAAKEGALARLQLAASAARLGTLSVARSGPMGFAEVSSHDVCPSRRSGLRALP